MSSLDPVPARLIPRVLSIAGSDSGGGAGIQADLKAFAACGVHGMTAITAITAQNTVGVSAIHQVPGEVIIAQVRAVQDDIGVDAVKIGMLGDLATIDAVADALDLLPSEVPIVLDPVMVSESGSQLLEAAARRGMLEKLLPRVDVVTPNLPEAGALVAEAGALVAEAGALVPEAGALVAEAGLAAPAGSARAAAGAQDPLELARTIRTLGPPVVVVTGGHREEPVDVFFDGRRFEQLEGELYPGGAAHGSGCTHSSVLAARLAWGDDPLEAARVAKRLASRAVRDGLAEIGAGAGPVDVLGLRARVPAG